MRIIVLMLISFLLSANSIKAQSKAEIAEMVDFLSPNNPAKGYSNKAVEGNEFVKGMLYFYKNYISSQDASNCSFSPSCSEYAAIAIKKQGLIIGLMNFSDRFSRCNGQDPMQYEYIKEHHLLFDPVRDIKYQLVE